MHPGELGGARGRGPERLSERSLLAALALLSTVPSIVSSLGVPLLPVIAADNGVSLSDATWTLTAPLLSGAIATPIVGRLGGNRRRRPVLLVVMLMVTLGSVLSALPLGFGPFLVGRLLQGTGLAVAPIAMAVARDRIRPERLPSAVAALAVAAVIGSGLGFPLSSLIAEFGGVAAAYWCGFAVALVALAAAWLAVPPGPPGPEPRMDWLGVGLLSLASAGLLLCITEGQVWGWSSPLPICVLVVAAVTLLGWIVRSLRTPSPLIDLRLAARKGVLGSNVTVLLVGSCTYSITTIVTIVSQGPASQGGLGQTVLVAGLLLLPYSFGSVLGSRINLWLGRRMRADFILPIGCALFVIATASLAFFHDTVWQLGVAMLCAGLGSGSTFVLAPAIIMRWAPRQETGSAISCNHLLRTFGFAAGSALAGVILQLSVPAGAAFPTPAGIRTAALASSGIALVACVVAFVLALRNPPRRAAIMLEPETVILDG